MTAPSLGAQVRARAEELGVSVETLADALGLDVAQVEALFRDELPLNTQIARGLARALKTCAGYWWAVEKGDVR